jgi:hypothetical protein
MLAVLMIYDRSQMMKFEKRLREHHLVSSDCFGNEVGGEAECAVDGGSGGGGELDSGEIIKSTIDRIKCRYSSDSQVLCKSFCRPK